MVTDPEEMEKIFKMAKKFGGTMSFSAIEQDPKNNLRDTNGMTAWAICQKFQELKATAKGEAPPKADDENLVAGE